MPPQASALCRRRRRRRKESSQTRLDHLVCFCKALQTTGEVVEKFSYCNDCFLYAVEKKTKTVEDDDDEMEGEEEAKATSHSEEQITNGDEDEGGEEEEEEGETENEDQPELPSGLTGMILLSLQSGLLYHVTVFFFFCLYVLPLHCILGEVGVS